LVEVGRHPNIKVLSYTEVESIEGEAGDFVVRLVKKPRYVIQEKCTGCGVCQEYCPVKIPDAFNQEISKNKAIHIHFAQAIPLIAYISKECLYLKEKKCGICENVCENKAIDFNQKPEKVDIKVGAVIISAGFEPFDARLLKEYGYGKYKNVVTSMDYERILSSTGPYEGEIKRTSDLKHPKKIAWIQCIGSRSVQEPAKSYCSSVCCTYTQKQVILTKDHDSSISCTVFHNDIRAYGKDFERFYQRAQKLQDVRFIRSYVTISKEDPLTGNVWIRYSTPDKGVIEEEFEMVVLSVGLTPPKDVEALAGKFGIELNAHRFAKVSPFTPVETTKKGIYVSSAFISPMDIPEAVITASSASAKSGELLKSRKGKLATKRVYPVERDVSKEETRVGVFVCACGANIGRVVDIKDVVEYAKTLPHVVHAQPQLFSCSTESAKQITEAIKEKNLNRVIVAACTPRTHEPTFRDSLREAGLNQYYVDMANIREHCSWVHPKDKEAATKKAKDLVRKSVARSLKLQALEEIKLPVDKKALVVGGGVAGMNTALSIAKQGFEVYLIEREKELGGNARFIKYTLEGYDVQEYLKNLISEVYKNQLIHVITEAEIVEATGYIGNFLTKVKVKNKIHEIKHGVVFIATGAVEYKPKEYLYGVNEKVVTNRELENLIFNKDAKVTNCQSLVMIQCVGCRNEERNYCSRICCGHSIKNAIKFKEINPSADVYILYRDMRTYGFKEDYYRLASELGVRFIRYAPEEGNNPSVEEVVDAGKKVLKVMVFDPVLQKQVELDADLISLASAIIPDEKTIDVAGFFKVSTSVDGFFKEAHVKLRPVDFGTDGVFLAGFAHYPKYINETISQSLASASRAVVILSSDTVSASGSICDVEEKKCIGCGACAEVCAYTAIELYKTAKGMKAKVNPVLCKGDGLCNAVCPTGAIQLKHFTDEQLTNEIDSALPEIEEKKLKKVV